MDQRRKKKRSVWLVAIILVLILVPQALFNGWIAGYLPIFWAAVGVSLLAMIGVVLAARSRIKEIEGGEEDDLSQY